MEKVTMEDSIFAAILSGGPRGRLTKAGNVK